MNLINFLLFSFFFINLIIYLKNYLDKAAKLYRIENGYLIQETY
jgi:hypothetical protein